MREILEDVTRWQREGKRIALARVISLAGSAPRGVGAALALSHESEISGSVSGGCVEPAVIEEGLRALRTGRPTLLSYGISEEQNVERIGLSCGGEIEVFVEPLTGLEPLFQAMRDEEPAVRATVIAAPAESALLGRSLLITESAEATGDLGDERLTTQALARARDLLGGGDGATETFTTASGASVRVFFDVYQTQPTLLIVGAGHVSIPLTRLAKVLGYHVVVIDARAAFATRERLPDADELVVEWPDEAMARYSLSRSSAVAILTHDEKFDVPALVAALGAEVGYVGAIGSRGTREKRDQRLREAGITDAQIARIHGPIGLDIGAKTPDEIALAILAEIVATRRGKAAIH